MKWVSDRALCQELVRDPNLMVILPSPELLGEPTAGSQLATVVESATLKVVFALTSQAMLELVNWKKGTYKTVKMAAETLEQEIGRELNGRPGAGDADYECYIVEPTEISMERAVQWANTRWFTVCLWKLALPRLTSSNNRTKGKNPKVLISAVPQKDWSFLATASALREYGDNGRVFIETSYEDGDVIGIFLDPKNETTRDQLGLPRAFTYLPDTTTEQEDRKEIPLEPKKPWPGGAKVAILDTNEFGKFINWARRAEDDARKWKEMWEHLEAPDTAQDVFRPNLVLFPVIQRIESARKAVFGEDHEKNSPREWSKMSERITNANLQVVRLTPGKQSVYKDAPDFDDRKEFQKRLDIRKHCSFASNGETAWTFLNEFTDWEGQPGSADLMYTACCYEIQEELTMDNVFAQTQDRKLKEFLNKQKIKNPWTTEERPNQIASG